MSLLTSLAARLPFSLPWRAALWSSPHPTNDRATIAFLENTFARYFPAASAAQHTQWARQHLQLLALERMDAYVMQRVGKRTGVRLQVEGSALLENAARGSQGVILVFNHYDRILTGAIALAHQGFRLNSLRMELDENAPIPGDVKHFLNTKTQKFERIVGGISLGRRDSMRRLYKGLMRGENWCIVADAWDEAAPDKKPYPFLGSTIYLSNSVERIAQRTGAQLIHVASYSKSACVVKVRLTALQPTTAMQETLALLEADVSKNPWAWWNWGVLEALQKPPG